MIYPLNMIGKRKAVISDYYSARKTATHRKHEGVDLMYPRTKTDTPYSGKDTILDSRGFVMLPDALALSVCGGVVVKVRKEGHGVGVKIRDDYSPRVDGYNLHWLYLHLRWACVVRGQGTHPGMVIGKPGDDPRTKDPEHLHLGLRVGEYGPYIDPTPYLAKAAHVALVTSR